jgi:hypothetical protein
MTGEVDIPLAELAIENSEAEQKVGGGREVVHRSLFSSLASTGTAPSAYCLWLLQPTDQRWEVLFSPASWVEVHGENVVWRRTGSNDLLNVLD